jgi:hypothetical protein
MGERMKILPGTGRGTMERSGMVEGAHLSAAQTWAPSTAFGGPPPRAGEDQA